MTRRVVRALALLASTLVVSSCTPGIGGALFYGASAQTQAGQTQGLIPHALESYIVGEFEGFDYGNLYQLANGQLWEQTEHYFWYYYWYGPPVTIYADGATHKMLVAGISHPVTVRRVR